MHREGRRHQRQVTSDEASEIQPSTRSSTQAEDAEGYAVKLDLV